MEHVSARNGHRGTNGRKKKKEGDGRVACSFQGGEGMVWAIGRVGGGNEEKGGVLGPVAKGIELCVHEAYPKGTPI